VDEYLQFRFAQGAPDKEQRFINQVSEVSRKTKNPYPTIFAWHGKFPLWNSEDREPALHLKPLTRPRSFFSRFLHSTICSVRGKDALPPEIAFLANSVD
jgi:hypothetical protein